MTSEQPATKDITEYIAGFPADVQKMLQKIRETIQKEAPQATEAISYQIPTFKISGKNFIHFAAFKKHIGLYPAPRGVDEFEPELSFYEGGKGTAQFPLDKPIPYDLITRIVQFRMNSLATANQKPASK